MTQQKSNALQRWKEQKQKLEARIQAAEAREKVKARKEETRRKILVGSYYLDQAMKQNRMEDIKQLMAGFLTRDSDRKLFGLADENA